MVLKSGLGSQLHLFLKSSKSRAHIMPPPKSRSFISSAFSLICLASSKLTHWSPLNAYGPIRRFLSWTTVQPFFKVLSQICNCPEIKNIFIKNLRRKKKMGCLLHNRRGSLWPLLLLRLHHRHKLAHSIPSVFSRLKKKIDRTKVLP